MPDSGSDPRVVLVVGVGRSGTSAVAGVLAQLGYAVPQPEVEADPSNPRGFNEPQWVVDFHETLLRRRHISNFDGRPRIWQRLDEVTDAPVAQLRAWLSDQLDRHDRLVVKDPRTVWCLEVWRRATQDLGVDPAYVTSLRPPAEVVRSARAHYGGSRQDTPRLAGWTNVMLHTEWRTRGTSRAFVDYHRLVQDWRAEIARTTPVIGVDPGADDAAAAAVDALLDPALIRQSASLDDLETSARLRTLAGRTWDALSAVGAGRDRSSELDAVRADYDALYDESLLLVHHELRALRAKARARASAAPPRRRGWLRRRSS